MVTTNNMEDKTVRIKIISLGAAEVGKVSLLLFIYLIICFFVIRVVLLRDIVRRDLYLSTWQHWELILV